MTDNDYQRSALTVEVVVETKGMSPAEHEKRVAWAQENLNNACKYMEDAFVTLFTFDVEEHLISFHGVGKGKPSPDLSRELTGLKEGPQTINPL